MTSSNDDFNRADGGLGANYSAFTGVANRLTIVSTAARAAAVAQCADKWTGGSAVGTDMYARATYDILDAANCPEIAFLWRVPNTGTVADGYYAYQGLTNVGFQSIAGGTPTSLLTVAVTPTAASHVLMGRSRMGTHEVWHDSIRRLVNRNTTYSTGGRSALSLLATAATNDAEYELFEWGDVDDLNLAEFAQHYMGVAGNNMSATTTTTLAVDMPDAATRIQVGDVLIAIVGLDNNGTNGATSLTSITDPRNTWTVDQATVDPGAAAAGATLGIGRCVVTTAYANGDDVTLNMSPSTIAKNMTIHVLRQMDVNNLVAVAFTSATGTSTTPSVARTPDNVGQIVIGAVAVEGPGNDAFTPDADTTDGSWMDLHANATNDATATNNITTSAAIKKVTGTSAQTWNPTLGTSRDWVAGAIVLNVAPPPRDRIIVSRAALQRAANW